MGIDRVWSAERVYVDDVIHNAELQPTQVAYGNGAQRELAYEPDSGFVDRIYDHRGASPILDRRFDYDLTGKITTATDAVRLEESLSGVVYDGLGRLERYRRGSGPLQTNVYDPLGNLVWKEGTPIPYQHPTKPHAPFFTYDAANRLTSITNRSADGTIVHQVAYTRDPDGNLVASQGSDGPASYAYDALNRLTVADLPGTADDRSYQYDAVGNRKVETIGAQTRHYVYDPGNRLRDVRLGSPHGPLVFRLVHDANGAITEKQDATGETIWRLTRNQRGQVTRISVPGLVENFGYDPGSLRVRRSGSPGTSLFHWDGDGLESVYDATGNLRADYLRGAVIDEVVVGFVEGSDGGPLVNATFHHDPVTSVVGLSGHSGTVEQRRVYAPFGETLSETAPSGGTGSGPLSNELAYTGRERDPATGLYYVRARWYDPEIGRFLSEDPLGFDAGDINLYAYVGNNPLGGNDPLGQEAIGLSGGITIPVIPGLVSGEVTLSGTLVFDPRRFDIDFIVTGEGGAGIGTNGILPGSAFLRGVASFDRDVTVDSFTGPAPSTTLDALLLSGSATRTPQGNVFEAGFTTPSIGVSVSEGVGFSVSDIVNGAIDFFTSATTPPPVSDIGSIANPGLGSTTSPGAGAGGGFILFPNRANLNQLDRVYQK
jgi:RHS repeat-associated protein